MLELLQKKARGLERRLDQRAACHTVVRVFPDDEDADLDVDWFSLESTDVSPNGVFLKTDLLFPVGEELDLEFTGPGDEGGVRSRGRVVRVVADSERSGVAVELSGLNRQERGVLNRIRRAQRR